MSENAEISRSFTHEKSQHEGTDYYQQNLAENRGLCGLRVVILTIG